MAGVGQLEHVIVVMLENRAFDHLLGFLGHPDASFDGVTPGADTNPLDPDDPDSGTVRASRRRRLRLRVDPDHAHEAVMAQLGLVGDAVEPTNDGFVRSYEEKATGRGPGPGKARRAARCSVAVAGAAGVALVGFALAGLWALVAVAALVALVAVVIRLRFVPKADHFPGDGTRIMWCWSPDRLPALATLARSFAVCTRWFSSVPGETWPNRQFAHAATSAGTVDIELCLYDDRTIFELLEEHDRDWRIYYDGPAQVLCYPALWSHPERVARWHPIHDLFEHIERDELPAYSFVEPNHGYVGRSYSQHPGNNRVLRSDFRHGDRFVAAIYEALRSRPDVFARTVLLVTYDEHGGTWDHVPPPRTKAPDGKHAGDFDFTRLGPRVPAIVVSPWIEAGTVDALTYDHASIPATLRRRFAPHAAPLTARDADAGDFLSTLGRAVPRRGDELPDLSGLAWRPRASATPLDTLVGWVKGLARVQGRTERAFAWLAAQFDAAVEPGAVPRGAPPPVPEPVTPRRTATRAVRKLATAAERARSAGTARTD